MDPQGKYKPLLPSYRGHAILGKLFCQSRYVSWYEYMAHTELPVMWCECPPLQLLIAILLERLLPNNNMFRVVFRGIASNFQSQISWMKINCRTYCQKVLSYRFMCCDIYNYFNNYLFIIRARGPYGKLRPAH